MAPLIPSSPSQASVYTPLLQRHPSVPQEEGPSENSLYTSSIHEEARKRFNRAQRSIRQPEISKEAWANKPMYICPPPSEPQDKVIFSRKKQLLEEVKTEREQPSWLERIFSPGKDN